jgi:secernin
MCDTLCGHGPDGMVFGKNSDRPPGEVQLAVPFGRRASAGCTLRTQYLSIGDTGAHAAFLSCPTWLWGAEHGVNEFGVAIGNERVSTVHRAGEARPALIGMDLVRLGLERARSAEEAVEVMAELLTTHGQGGIANATRGEAYDSSFLIADAQRAFVLETSGSSFAAAPFPAGTAISNRISLGAEWSSGSSDLEPGEDFGRFRDQAMPTTSADVRLAASRSFLATRADGQLSAAAMASHLRDHGQGPWGAPGTPGEAQPPTDPGTDLSGISVCMHAPDLSVTTASLIAVLPTDIGEGAPVRTYVALGSPCASIFIPAFPRTAHGPPPFIPFELSSEALWRAADAVRRRVDAEPNAIAAVRARLAPVEDALWAEADEVGERPDRRSEIGRDWGRRALDALIACVD